MFTFLVFNLIRTDGYSIDVVTTTTSREKAVQALRDDYALYKPYKMIPEWDELSYLGESNALLYANGENVYSWKIIRTELSVSAVSQ